MERLTRALYDIEEAAGFEVEERGGALHLTFDEPPGTFVISPNSAARQIWISALTTSFKLDWSDSYTDFVLGSERRTAAAAGGAPAHPADGQCRRIELMTRLFRLSVLLGVTKMRWRDHLSRSLSRILRNKRLRSRLAQLAAQIVGDLASVETPVLNEYLAGIHSRDDHPRQINSSHIALQRVRVHHRLGGSLL